MLLNNGLEKIGEYCFAKSRLEKMSIPGSVKFIQKLAFTENPLTQVRFLGIAGNELRRGPKSRSERSSGNTKCSHLKSKSRLVIGEEAFSYCTNLRQVVFEPGSAVEEIQCKAFYRSGLETFTAPPSLRKIGPVAFRECRNLKKFELNKGVQKLGWFCLLGTETKTLSLPPHMKVTREQLGLDQEDPKVLHLPRGLKVVGAEWFTGSNIEKVFIPNTVRELGNAAFCCCN